MRSIEQLVISILPSSLRARIGKIGVEHKQIARGMVTVASFLLLAKSAALAKEMAVAWRYGVSETIDAYLFVFNLTQWPLGILTWVLASVLVPLASRIKHETSGDLPRFRSELLGSGTLLGLTIGAGAWLFIPWLVQQPWVGLNNSQGAQAREMAVYLAWLLPFGLLASIFATWTMVANRHHNTLLDGAPALAILIAVLLTGGLEALVWGTLGGFAIQALLLYIPLARRGDVERPVFSYSSPHWQIFFAGFGLMLIAQALMSFVNIADQFFAAHLGPGALSTLGYANRILALVLGLGTVVISRAALPVLSRAHMNGHVSIVIIAYRWGFLMFIAGSGVTLIGLWLAPTLVELIFQRGQFTAQDTTQVAELLRYALIQVPFCFAAMIFVYALLSQGRHRAMILIAGLNILTKVSLAFILVPVMGLNGLILATAGVYLVGGTLALVILRK